MLCGPEAMSLGARAGGSGARLRAISTPGVNQRSDVSEYLPDQARPCVVGHNSADARRRSFLPRLEGLARRGVRETGKALLCASACTCVLGA